jgi:fibronectin-binding autotransporter adhesin
MHGRMISLYRASLTCAFLAAGVFLSDRTLSADSFDWRNVGGLNWNTSVKSQFGGTCWDFSSCGTLEAHYMLTRDDINFQPDVSEQHICWETSPEMGGTGGGWGTEVLNYFTSHGVVAESVIPHDPAHEDTPAAYPTDPWPLTSVFPSPDSWTNHVWKTTSNQNGIVWYDSSNPSAAVTATKNYLKARGPLLVGIWAGHDLYWSVQSMIDDYRAPDASGYDHQVVLVGYVDDARIPTGGYWIIKNSWGYGSNNPDDYNSNGYNLIPYGNIEVHNDISSITGPAYYNGAMVAATWKGGAGTWSSGGNNWSGVDPAGNSIPTYAWENTEISATFSGTETAVNLSGKVIAHGLTIASGTGTCAFNGVNNPSLTITVGGITANGNVTINSPVKIGGQQTWTVASGKTLTVNGDLHTIISPLTITGSGHTYLGGSIDGGGAANLGGMAPGSITKSGSGVLHFTGAGTTYAVPLSASGSISFDQSGTVAANYTSTISGTCVVMKTNPGTIILSGSNNYSGTTLISGGALQADNGVGLPSSRFLRLNGGVLQSNSAVTFTRNLGTSNGTFEWTSSGGGFSAGAGPMAVRVNGGTSTISWGTSGNVIKGTLKFGSLTSTNVVTFQNGINMTGSTRTFDVVDNPNSTADWAEISGVVTYGTGTAGITKTGDGTLFLSATNTYNGTTTFGGGALQATIGTGIPSTSFFKLDGGVYQSNGTYTFNRSLGTSGSTFQWTANGGGFSAGSGAMTVNIGGGSATLNWGTGVGSGIMGALKLNSSTSNYGLTFQNPINLNGGARTIDVGGNTATITSLISDSVGTGSLTKGGAGTLVLPIANTFSGNLSVTGGMLVGSVFNAYGPMSSSRAISVSGGGTLSLPFSDMLGTYTSAIPSVTLNNGAVLNASGTHQAFNTLSLSSGTLSAAGDAGVPGSGGWGSWNLDSLVTSSGTSLIGGTDSSASVTLQSGDVANASTTFDVQDGSLTIAMPIYNGIDGHMTGGSYLLHTTSLVKTGGGTLTLNAVNSYSGTTTINGGVISTNNLASAGVNCGIGSGSSLVFDGGGLVYSGTASLTFDRTITLGAGGGILGASGGSFTYLLPITGAGSFTFQGGGSGTMTLSGSAANTYSGYTTVTGGTLVLAKTSGYAIPGSFTIANAGTTVVVQNANQFPTTSVVTFSGTEYPTLELYGHNVTVAGFGGAGVIENTETETGVGNGTLTVNNSANYTFSGSIRNSAGGSGVLSLTKGGDGALTLVGANTGSYGGVLTVNAGTLDYSAGALPAGVYRIAGGTLNIGSLSKTIGSFRLSGGTVSGSGTLTSTATYDIQAGAVSAVLAGAVNLSKTTSGSATVSSPAYTGNTIVQDGRLTFTGNLPTGNCAVYGGTLDIGSLSTPVRTFNITGGTATGSGSLNVTVGGFTIQGGRVDVALAGSSTALTKSGSTTAILNGANTYGGYTAVTAGTLQLGPAAHNAVLTLGGANIQSGRMVFDYAGGSDPAATILSLLTASYNGGLWNVGKFKDTTATTTGLTLGWLDNSVADTVTVMATYPGDFNLDGVADAADMAIIRSGLGSAGTWATGDANYDGFVNLLDWNLWKTHVGLPALSIGSSAAGVPEPSTLLLLLVGFVGMMAYVRQRSSAHGLRQRSTTSSSSMESM